MSRHAFRAQTYVEHMLEACQRVERYLEHFTLDQFLEDSMR